MLAGIILLSSFQGFSQNLLTGRVMDADTRQPLPYVNVLVQELKLGATTDFTGKYSFNVPAGDYQLTYSYLGYETISRTISITSDLNLPDIWMEASSVYLDEVRIIAPLAQKRKTPVTVSNIRKKTIQQQLGDQAFPQIMKMVAGVYPTRYGGGSGDARVSIRGFQQENISLLLNGVPIGSVENGLVYWNNWIGLSEATNFIQVQKGLGASRVALNSVGGTINIITNTTDAEAGGALSYATTDYGNSKTTLSLSTGKLDNGLAVSFMGSHTKGPGYVDATYVESWAFFLSMAKDFGKHKLIFTALGAPERHGQRNSKLSQAEIDRHGIKFNKDWGSYNGRINNLSENYYFKPQFALNHYFNINKKSMLATSVYLSTGKGGGKWSDTYQPIPFQNTNPQITDFRNPSGQIDWESVYQNNFNNTDTAILANGDTVPGFSNNIQTDFLASHIWTGIISTYEYKLTDHFTLTGGFHYRYFKSKLQQKVRDLLGGKFYIDDYSWSLAGVAGRDQIKQVGDVVKVDNGAIINFTNAFGEAEYANGGFSTYLSGSIYNNWFQREDRYNYVEDIKSNVVSMAGFDVKAGANYNLNEFHNVYFNTGYFSRVPYYKFVFGNFTNEASRDLVNEKITYLELGYGFKKRMTSLELNAYYTYWADRSFLANEYNQFLDPVMISGLDALHQGLEMELTQGIGKKIKVGALASLGDWKWKNDVDAKVFNDDNVVTDTVKIYADGLYVGDAPQTQFGLKADFRILKSFSFIINYLYYDDLYADFNPTGRSNPEDKAQPYKLPAYSTTDVHLSYDFLIFKRNARVSMSCYNLFNETYIVRGEDGASHDLDTFRGFWAFGRNFNFSLNIKL